MFAPYASPSRLRLSLILVGALAGVALGQHRGHWHSDRSLESGPVPAILEKAIAASKTCRYRGTRIIDFSRGPHGGRHEEIVTRDGEFTRIEFASTSKFAGQIIVENATERRHYFPDRNEIRILPPRREEALDHLIGLARHDRFGKWSMEVVPGGTVAGHSVSEVVISDPYGNVAQRIDIEPRSGVVLKRRLYDPVGGQIGLMEFRDIDLNPRPFSRSLFRFERRGAVIITPYDSLKEMAAAQGFIPLALPRSSGFRLDWVRVSKIAGEQVLVQVYSSGHTRLSLFQVNGSVDPNRLRSFAKRELRFRSWRSSGRTFVLMGGDDDSTLDRLARSLGSGTDR